MMPAEPIPIAPNDEKPTLPYEAATTLPCDQREPAWAGRVADSGPMPTGEIRQLLQSRLRMLSLVCAVFFSLSLPMQLLMFGLDPDVVWSALLPQCVILLTMIGNTVTLGRDRQRSLAWLRADEVVCFAALTIPFSCVQFYLLRGGLPAFAPQSPFALFILAGAWDFTWFVLIVAYGLFIPNTWRRCAVVVAILAAIPLGMAAVVGLSTPAISGPVFGQFLFLVGIHVALAAAFAVFAARRDEMLRMLAIVK